MLRKVHDCKQRMSLTPPVPVPSPDQKGGGLCVGLVTPPHKTLYKHSCCVKI